MSDAQLITAYQNALLRYVKRVNDCHVKDCGNATWGSKLCGCAMEAMECLEIEQKPDYPPGYFDEDYCPMGHD